MIKDLIKWAKTFPPISVPYKKSPFLLALRRFSPSSAILEWRDGAQRIRYQKTRCPRPRAHPPGHPVHSPVRRAPPRDRLVFSSAGRQHDTSFSAKRRRPFAQSASLARPDFFFRLAGRRIDQGPELSCNRFICFA